MNGSVLPQPADPDWARLLDAEAKLETEISAEEELARVRVAAARAAASAVPDPQTLAELSAAREQADAESQRSALARMGAEADATVRALQAAPDSLVDALARKAVDAVLTEALAAGRR